MSTKTTARKLKYYAPVEVRFTAQQMEQIIADNMETWGLTREQAMACNDEDVFAAASRLDLIDLPNGAIFSEGE